MIKLSKKYQDNIIKMFGSIGENWLDNIPNMIEKYIKKFNLKNVKLLNKLTYNVLLFADSDEYGSIVLKVEIPFKEMTIRESVALKLNNGVGACKCYYSNIDDGVIILERLIPGNTLNIIDDISERIKIFKDVSSKFNIKVSLDNELPTYKEILQRSLDIANNNEEKFTLVKDLLPIINSMYEELHSNNESDYLLHSDLYSDNILQVDNGWKAIDPHGFIGEKILDTAIFIQKELEKTNFNEDDINHILNLMNIDQDLNLEEVTKALYINYVLNICWDIEVNLGEKHIDKCINRSKIILNYLNNINNKRKKIK